MTEVKTAALVEALKADLKSGVLAPGQRLVELELTRRFDVGRGVVREALRHLAAEGLAVIEPNRGAAIRKLTAADIAHIYDVRALLEGLAARCVASNGEVEGLAALWPQMKDAAATADVRRYVLLNARFHELLIEASGNPFLAEAAGRLRTPIMRYQFMVLMDPAALRQSHAEHEAIVQSIMARDAPAAEAAMRAHIDSSRTHVLPHAR